MTPADFLAALGHERFTAQVFPDNDSSSVRPCILHGPHQVLERRLRDLNQRGAGIYFMVNRGDLRGRRKENVVAVLAYFCDLDGAPLLAPDAYPVPPTVIVASSPNKYHLYWRVEGAPLESFSHTQEHLAVLLGGDTTVKDLPRVMRLPGYEHRKADPYLVTVIHHAPNAYDHADFMHAFAIPEYQPLPPLPEQARAYVERKRGANHHVLLDRVAGAGNGQRNQTLFSMAAAMANDVAKGEYDRATMIEEATAAALQAGLSEREARQTISSALRYARVN